MPLRVRWQTFQNALNARRLRLALMSNDDVDARRFDIGTTSIRLVHVGNVVQILFRSSLEAKFLFRGLAEKHKRAEAKLKGA